MCCRFLGFNKCQSSGRIEGEEVEEDTICKHFVFILINLAGIYCRYSTLVVVISGQCPVCDTDSLELLERDEDEVVNANRVIKLDTSQPSCIFSA